MSGTDSDDVDFPPDDTFVLDSEEVSDQEWQERPRCNWRYSARTEYIRQIDGTLSVVKHERFDCLLPVAYRLDVTYSNASKTSSLYCKKHGALFHADTFKWFHIEHNTKASSRITILETDTICPCSEGNDCEIADEFNRIDSQIKTPIAADVNAKKAWNY